MSIGYVGKTIHLMDTNKAREETSRQRQNEKENQKNTRYERGMVPSPWDTKDSVVED